LAASAPTSAREQVRPIAPKLVELAEKVVYGDVWERPGLSKRDRSLITVATLVALGRERQLRGHLERALANGVSKGEVGELITHLALLCGLARGDDRGARGEGGLRRMTKRLDPHPFRCARHAAPQCRKPGTRHRG
jgi:4-carboxymuconolactone decarboxylase